MPKSSFYKRPSEAKSRQNEEITELRRPVLCKWNHKPVYRRLLTPNIVWYVQIWHVFLFENAKILTHTLYDSFLIDAYIYSHILVVISSWLLSIGCYIMWNLDISLFSLHERMLQQSICVSSDFTIWCKDQGHSIYFVYDFWIWAHILQYNALTYDCLLIITFFIYYLHALYTIHPQIRICIFAYIFCTLKKGMTTKRRTLSGINYLYSWLL